MTNTIKEYNKKRNFAKTGEPRGEAEEPMHSKRLRFVVQHHIAGRDHYDFRLEGDGVLKSWAVPKGPSYDSHDKRLAVQVEDHPLEYRNFEGIIPKGQYGGGVVMIWDEGYWQPLEDASAGFAAGSIKFTLDGDRLQGRWALVRMKPKSGEKAINWLLIKEKDAYDKAFELKQLVTSVRTGRSMAAIEAGIEEPQVSGKSGNDLHGPDAKPLPRARTTPQAGRSAKDVAITHPDKLLFTESGITKGDVAGYYTRMARRMMPYLENRILSVVRCPSGIEDACFFKKHPANGSAGLGVIPVPAKDGGTEEYVYAVDAYGLLSEVQMNTLEFHTWGSRIETLERPDIMVFDLDPDQGMDLERIRQGVKDLKTILDQLTLQSYLKTSGGKGYHVVVPFRPASGWDAFHMFAKNIAGSMEAMWPDRYTSNVRKERRKNRIFIDWMRNGRGATSVAPYSIRARAGAPVSMPIAWTELDTVTPNGISMDEAVKRLRRKDPWGDFFDTRQRLKE